MVALRRALAAGYSNFAEMDQDRALDPLRGRADFQALTLDRGFPLVPFAGAAERPLRGPAPMPATTAPTPDES
jgi:hypothetical protein